MTRPLGRLLTAMATPFDTSGAVDLAMARRLARALVEAGSDGVVVNGTTGESPTLSDAERWSLLDAVRDALPDNDVLMGTGSYSTEHTVEATREALRHRADAALVVTPYYNRPPQEGLIAHYERVADVGLPIVLYNIPARCGVNVSVETTLHLAAHPAIVGTKEAAGDVEQVARICASAPEGFRVWSGDDGLTLPFMSAGAYGLISVASHVCGGALRRLVDAAAAGDLRDATALHLRLLPLFKAMFAITNPIGVKAALQIAGADCGGLRLPLVPMPDALRNALEATMASLGDLVALPIGEPAAAPAAR
jgi:4-hydroxy-tetrahydrodipicolinate synthase